MPSIFEKPSLLGFRAEGGAVDTPYTRASRAWTSPIGSVRPGTLTINPLDSVPTEGGLPQWLARNIPAGVAGLQDFVENAILSPAIYAVSGYDTGESAQKEKILREMGYGVPETTPAAVQAPATSVAPTYNGPPSIFATAPVQQEPLPGLGGGDVPTATSEFMNRLLKLPTSADVPSVVSTMFENARQQQPAGSRAERVAAAMKSGDFETKRAQYNQEAMRLGQPTQMDAQGNIVGRELSQEEKMREAFNRTGGNTPFMQTTDPMQRALQNEMMKQARAQATVNTFGFTPEERLANLQAETEARQILRSPLNSGVREVAPGVRAATRDGQVVGFSTPGDGKTAPQGTIKDPITGEVMPLDLYNEMTRQTQAAKGMTGGSPMERGLIAAMAAEEERKKKMASDAAAATLAATPPTTEAELIARTPAMTIPPKEKPAPKATPPSRLTPLKDIRGSSYVDPTTGQKMIW